MSHEANSLEPFPVNDYGLPQTTSSSGNREIPVRPAAETIASSPGNLGLTSTSTSRPRGAYEIKFLITETQSVAIQEWARVHMLADPHSSVEHGYGYAVNSVYLDTPTFDVFHRADKLRQRKFRLRRYGSEPVIWMELKRKINGRVHKRRTAAVEGDLSSMLLSSDATAGEGGWFRQQIQELQLRPICQVTYQRFACVGTSSSGPLRLTLDSQLHCQGTDDWTVPAQQLPTGSLLQNQQILELKFHETIPNSFRDLIHDQRLNIATFSKYRQSVETCISLDRLMRATSSE